MPSVANSTQPNLPAATHNAADMMIHLSQTDCRVAQALLAFLPASSNCVTLSNRSLANALNRSIRTVQNSLKHLAEVGLVSRCIVTPTDTFSMYRTTLNVETIREVLAAIKSSTAAYPRRRKAKATNKRNLQAKNKTDLTVNTTKFPFRYLRGADRYSEALGALEEALSDSCRYMQFLADHASTPDQPVRVALTVQRRSVRNGERGAPIWRKEVPAWNTAAICAYARAQAAKLGEVAFQLVDEKHRVLLIDDVPPEQLHRLPAQALIIETSPRCYQVTLIAGEDLTNEQRKAAQKGLVAEFGGDPGAMSSNQLRRLPGSLNNKPKLSTAFVARLHRLPDATNAVLRGDYVQALISRGAKKWPTNAGVKQGDELAAAVKSGTPTQDQSRGTDSSQSGRDMSYAMSQLRRGIDREVVIKALADRAYERKKRDGTYAAAREYAELTVYKAEAFLRQGKQRSTRKQEVRLS